MEPKNSSRSDRIMAAMCRGCVVCRHARKRQRGIAYTLVEKIETKTCPFCKAYERVYGKKAHEPWQKDDVHDADSATNSSDS